MKDLRFFSSRGIGFKDLSSLRNAHRLFLSGILELTDVSLLGGVEELIIASCLNVKVICDLGRVSNLKLFQGEINSLEGLGEGNSSVSLSGLPEKIDLTPLRSIHEVCLSYCDCLVHCRELANVQHLSILYCQNFEDTSGLGNLKSLSLVECDKLSRLVGIGRVGIVHLEACTQLEDIDCLGDES